MAREIGRTLVLCLGLLAMACAARADDAFRVTPYLQNPLLLGADIVLLSVTKFLCGNATVIGGAVVGSSLGR